MHQMFVAINRIITSGQNISDSLLKLCHENLREFWGENKDLKPLLANPGFSVMSKEPVGETDFVEQLNATMWMTTLTVSVIITIFLYSVNRF